jgi:hypothetical protein
MDAHSIDNYANKSSRFNASFYTGRKTTEVFKPKEKGAVPAPIIAPSAR